MSYQDNIIVDKGHPAFRTSRFIDSEGNPTSQLHDLGNPKKKEGILWNTFQTLNKLENTIWLPPLGESIFGRPIEGVTYLAMLYWKVVAPPPPRHLWLFENLDHDRVTQSRGAKEYPERLKEISGHLDYWKDLAREGILNTYMEGCMENPLELDLVMDSPSFMIAIIGRNSEDIFTEETWDRERDEISKVIDLGLELTQGRKILYVLLVSDRESHDPPKAYDELLPRYRSEMGFLKQRLPHRTDAELERLQGRIDRTTWSHITDILISCGNSYPLGKRKFISNLHEYLLKNNLV